MHSPATRDGTPGLLDADQRARFWREGYLVAGGAVSDAQLSALRRAFDRWVAESAAHEASYGEAGGGRARFDLQPPGGGRPAMLRRVQAPTEISGAFLDVMRDSRMTDMVADLIGPNVKHHHNKINSKLPGSATEVRWHQDFAFTPHTNSDVVTALLMLDDVTEENGPLEVAPGSHRGPLHSLWHEGVFTGAVDPQTEARLRASAVRCVGQAGSVCLMHTRLAHGSAPNRSTRPRTLFICVYAAADAVACCRNPVANAHDGLVVRGVDPGTVRATGFVVPVPEFPKGSFFSQQSPDERGAGAAGQS